MQEEGPHALESGGLKEQGCVTHLENWALCKLERMLNLTVESVINPSSLDLFFCV